MSSQLDSPDKDKKLPFECLQKYYRVYNIFTDMTADMYCVLVMYSVFTECICYNVNTSILGGGLVEYWCVRYPP